MNIEKIEEYIDSIIEDYYISTLQKTKYDIVKEQKELNDTLSNYINSLPLIDIVGISRNSMNYKYIVNIINKYIVLYTLLMYGIVYEKDIEIYINNLIEFTRNQYLYSLKIDNFFDAQNNAIIIKMLHICRNILKFLNKELNEKDIHYLETHKFIDDLSEDFINEYLKKKDKHHRIVKTVMILLIYKINDRKVIYQIIEDAENNDNEYIYIDIVEPTTDTLNFDNIEILLSKDDLFTGVAHDLWDFIEETNEINKDVLSDNDKINILFNSGVIVPILDDFLLYHKNTEKYELLGVSKKKEDTKLKNIISKINTVTELYSDITKKNKTIETNILNNFNPPMYNKKVVLRNNDEDIKIINKIINLQKKNTDIIDNFNDMCNFRRYVYVNFKDFEKDGFSNNFNKTVTSIRAVNFDTTSIFKQSASTKKLQLRVGSKESIGNVVGLMIPTVRPIQCIKTGDVININDIKSDNNIFNLFVKHIKKNNKNPIYWIFDLEKDNVNQNSVQKIVAKIYDKIVKDIYFKILDKIDKIDPDLVVQHSIKIIKYFEKNVLNVPLSKDMYDDIEKYIFEKKIKNKDEEIYEDDVLYGIEGNVIKLPTFNDKILESINNTIVVDLSKIDETGKIISKEIINGICQHNISWSDLNIIRKKDYANYHKRLYDYIQQYVILNTLEEYICKSCGYLIDIDRFIQDGVFDGERGFVTFTMPMDTNLEDIEEYARLNFTLKVMDKNMEKIASSVGIPYFVGSSSTIKWRRKGIIKNTIDMVKQNTQLLSGVFKERNQTKNSKYGIVNIFSNLFVFEMENSIYQSSSKDKDQEQYKLLKRNNIITYMMIYLILEINETHISFFTSDKKFNCDILAFDKTYKSLFDNLKIIKNSSFETALITDYKILCYMMYMISCRIAKHRLWYTTNMKETGMKAIILIQKYVINTCVDIMNSILENSFNAKSSYIFEIFRVRFYLKLNTLFNNDEYYDLLVKNTETTKLVIKRRTHLKEIDVLPEEYIYNNIKWRKDDGSKKYYHYDNKVKLEIYNVSNTTNCPNGKFHQWIERKGSNTIYHTKCILCETELIVEPNKDNKKLIENFKTSTLHYLATTICLKSGSPHQYQYIVKDKKYVCLLCNLQQEHNYTDEELLVLQEKINNVMKERNTNYNLILDKTNNDIDKRQEIIDNLKKQITENYKKTFVDDFIDIVQDITGINASINLRYNMYIIDHDHLGALINDKITISDNDNKIKYNENHPFFKTNVIYYTNKTKNNVDVFYDAHTYKLIGYKELSKDFVSLSNSDKKIIINYSIYNKIKLLGYTGRYIEINKDIDEIRNICITRLDNLKKTIIEFQRIINKINNVHIGDITKNDTVEDPYFFTNNSNILIDKYVKKLNGIITNDIFTDYNINYVLEIDELKDIDINKQYVDAYYINKIDSVSEYLLCHIIENFNLMIQNNKTIRTQLSNFIIDFINMIFTNYNKENLQSIKEVRKYMHILKSDGFLRNIFNMSRDTTEGIYDEVIDDEEIDEVEKERRQDIDEELDAFDIDAFVDENMDEDYLADGMDIESEFDRLMDFEDSY